MWRGSVGGGPPQPPGQGGGEVAGPREGGGGLIGVGGRGAAGGPVGEDVGAHGSRRGPGGGGEAAGAGRAARVLGEVDRERRPLRFLPAAVEGLRVVELDRGG